MSVEKRTGWMLLSLIALLFALPRPYVKADTWIRECVDCPRSFWYMTGRSLVLDAHGRPHIAYGDDHLYYAWHDGAS